MNKQRKDVLNILYRHSVTNQREISELSGHSLGVVNKSIKELMNQGYINEKCSVTTKALKEFKEKAPKNAVILAAGYGMRTVPINTETPKGLLEVNGEVLIERIIRQLHEVGIYEIYVVVGFMKERYEYLIDDFGVELVVNEEYTTKNNLYSVKMVLNHLSNTYIIPCDIWCDKNPYHHHELYSWYMVSDLIDDKSTVRVNRKPKNAVILAAGYGMRTVPINTETPKGLLEVNGEVLIERIIRQLHEVGIYEIYVVVGFMKERYEYLIDDFGVELVVNEEYTTKNNLYSVKMVLNHLSNTYIIPCDIWCDKNPYHHHELYSWYMVSDLIDDKSTVRVNRKMELVTIPKAAGGNAMIGISYLLDNDAQIVKGRIEKLCNNPANDGSFWETALYDKDRMFITAKVVHSWDVVEINTYEQLREMDGDSNHLKMDAIQVICEALSVSADDIVDITVLKKGMTNRSFLFTCNGKKYIMRIPGEGTDQLINRRNEAMVYRTIDGRHICDDIAYINPDNGYKITEFLENARVCDPENYDDVCKCMRRLREFHELKLTVNHEVDIFGQLEFYESLWNGSPSAYRHYTQTKENVLSLRPYIEAHVGEKVLTHIDAVPDNFLFIDSEDGSEDIRLIDWEYVGMQDPHVDIAMFCIYAMYDRKQIDKLINAYFTEGCPKEIRIKIYCYIAACGLLWSNWCEYKRNLGIDFGEYSLRQYRYAKDYYNVVQDELQKMEDR